jgi:hypothetical protein
LKPHHPNVVEFAEALSAQGADYSVTINVLEMDDKTETLEVVVEGDDIHFDDLVKSIKALGGSLHSIDEVVAISDNNDLKD